jgi:predicted O-linked N-acetylglucosamine transferase (SPINDLY family)
MSPSSERLSEAIRAHQAGRLTDAEMGYRHYLAAHPDAVQAWHGLSLVCLAMEAWEEAEQCAREAVRLAPQIAGLHNALGNVLAAGGQVAAALKSFEQACQLNPREATFWLNQGMALVSVQNPQAAWEACQQAIALEPGFTDAWLHQGVAAEALNQFDRALHCYEQAARIAPEDPRPYSQLAQLAERQGQLDKAIGYCQQAIARDGDSGERYDMLGSLHFMRGSLAEAIEAYRQAVRLEPDRVENYCNLGTLYLAQENWDQAQAAFESALHIIPSHPTAHYGLGDTLVGLNRVEEALQHYTLAMAEAPDDAHRVRQAMFFPFLYPSCESIAQWRDRLTHQLAELERRVQERPLELGNPVQSVGRTPFYLPYQGFNDLEIQTRFARILAPSVPTIHLPTGPKRGRKPRVGFISKYLQPAHTIGKVMGGVLDRLSRQRFEITWCHLGEGRPASQLLSPQPVDRVLELPLWDTARAAQQLAAAELDVLVYCDIGMEPSSYFLGFSRLAPVQAVTWGHPITTGLPEMDYYLSGKAFEIDSLCQQHYSEQVVLLDPIPTYYRPPQLAGPAPSRASLGFTESDHLYVCPQSLYKLHPDFDPLMSGILQADPQAKLVFFEGFHPRFKEDLLARWQRTLPTGHDRIVFLNRVSATTFYHVLALSDVLLDPVHFGGGNTSLEALSFGTPIVTWPSQLLRGRFTYGFYRTMEIPDCVADSADTYIEQAVRLGTDPAYRHQLRHRILQANGVLYENPAVITAWENWLETALSKL